MSEFESVGKVSDFEIGRGRAVPVDGRMVAVFRQEDGSWHASDDLCPHMGASLAEGFVEGNISQLLVNVLYYQTVPLLITECFNNFSRHVVKLS